MKFSEVRIIGNTSTVMITMDADAASVKKEIAAIERSVKKLENKQLPLITEFEELRDKAAKAKQAIQEADKALASGKIDKVDHFLITDEATKNITTYNTKIEELRNKIEGLDNQIMPLKSSLESLKFTGVADNSLDTVGVQAKKNLEQAANSANKLSKNLSKVDQTAGEAASGIKSKMTGSLKSVEGSFKNFGKRIGSTIKSAFVFSVIYKGLTELRQYLGSMLSTNQQFTNSLNQVKSNLAVAFQPIYQAALPAINALLNLLVKASAYLAAFTSALFGVSMDSSISAAREMQNAVNAVQNGANGASAAERELTAAIKEKQKQVKALQKENKQLQREYEQQKKAVEAQTAVIEKQISSLEKSIDSIQKMEDAANKAAQAQREAIQKSIDLLEKQQEAIQKRSQAEQKAIDSQVKSLQKQQKALQKQYDRQNKAFDERIKNIQSQQERLRDEYDEQTDGIDSQIKSLEKEIKALRKAQKAAQEAEKANEKFTAGFDELSTLGAPDTDDPYDIEIEKLEEKIELLQEQKDAQSEAYEHENDLLQEQIDLIQEQKEALADSYESQRDSIQERIDKLQEEKEAIAEKYDLQNEKIQEQIDLLQAQQDAIKDADYSSSIDMYESRIASLREKIDELNASVEESPLIEQNELLIEQLQDEIDLLQEQKDSLSQIGTAASNFNVMIDKLKELKTEIENNPFYKWLTENQKEVKKLITVAGTLVNMITANVFGAFMGLIAVGGNAKEVIDRLKAAFKLFGEGLMALVNNDFETFKTKFVQGLYYLANAGIAANESICNAFIKALNWIIEKFNSWVASLPEDSFFRTEVFDGQIAYRAQEVNFPRLEVPALASGAVLPPNKPFMAWVGDQKNGTNVEAPLSTIEDALRNVMAEQEYNFEITADGSLGALIRLLNLHLNRENTRKTAF